ncbi:Hpt domain-containing protein [Arthrobacter celericrescens]|uniref:Hpt domain-containing protein n=1 Tax=Arthrobacter celericrescens TaxID=2320851 RepID=UPI000EA361C2|nr:Hpt domain-containing protein [Arthrobacter celericrescens]
MTGCEGCRGALVDPAVLHGLDSELGDATVTSAFVRKYVAMLPLRLSRLHHALDERNLDDAVDAVLSLKTSSDMVGAVCLRRLAAELEASMNLLPDGSHLADLVPQLSEIDHHVSDTIRCLESPSR